MPSLKQASKYFEYRGSAELAEVEIEPRQAGIVRDVRTVPLPQLPASGERKDATASSHDVDQLAHEAARVGLGALQGDEGPARDCLVYAGAIMLVHLGEEDTLQGAAERIRDAIDSGKARAHFCKNKIQ